MDNATTLSRKRLQDLDNNQGTAKIEIRPLPTFGLAASSFLPKLVYLRNAHLLGQCGIPVTAQCEILVDALVHEDLDAEILEAGREDMPFHQIRGEVFPLYGKWMDGFWHWMMEGIPTVIMAEAAHFTGSYIVPSGGSFIKESLEILGIAPSRIIVYPGGHIFAPCIVVPIKIMGAGLVDFPGVLNEMRRRFLLLQDHTELSGKNERFYVSRAKSQTRPRQVVNEEHVLNVLRAFDFSVIHFEDLSLREQILVASRSTAMVGPHGAGFLHTLFMQPRSLVVEFFSPRYINPTNLGAVAILDHDYRMLPSWVWNETYPHGDNIEVQLNLLELTIRSALECARK